VTRAAKLAAFVKLGRPQFLAGGLVFHGLGAAVAVSRGAAFDILRFVMGQLVVTATQLGTHYANDYFDLACDRANRTPTRWSGGSRVLPDGLLAPGVALKTAVFLYGVAGGLAIALALSLPSLPLIAPLAAAMIGLAWAYSAPPLRLSARGLGELGTAAVVTLCVPCWGAYVQAGRLDGLLLWVLPLPCALQIAMLIAIEFPDAAGDALSGKRTLVVQWGAPTAARVHAAIIVAGFGVLPFGVAAGMPPLVAFAALALAPLGIWQAVRVVRGGYGDRSRWASVAFWSVALLAGTGIAELAAILASLFTPRGG
jgi:1,4-dihydroxy-2-naphthoate polyprenyltransferase